MTFSENIKAERDHLGLNQSEVEALLGLGKGQITAWETERNTPHRWMQEGALRELRAAKDRASSLPSNTIGHAITTENTTQ